MEREESAERAGKVSRTSRRDVLERWEKTGWNEAEEMGEDGGGGRKRGVHFSRRILQTQETNEEPSEERVVTLSWWRTPEKAVGAQGAHGKPPRILLPPAAASQVPPDPLGPAGGPTLPRRSPVWTTEAAGLVRG